MPSWQREFFAWMDARSSRNVRRRNHLIFMAQVLLLTKIRYGIGSRNDK